MNQKQCTLTLQKDFNLSFKIKPLIFSAEKLHKGNTIREFFFKLAVTKVSLWHEYDLLFNKNIFTPTEIPGTDQMKVESRI